MVGVPEGLEGLLAHAVVGGGEDQEHAEEHYVAGDAARLCIVDLNGSERPDLVALDVKEVDVVRGDVHDDEEEQRVGDLPVEPLLLVEWQPADSGPDEGHQDAAHG